MANTRFWGLLRTFIDAVTIYTGDQISRLHTIASLQTNGALFAHGVGVLPRPNAETSLLVSAGTGLAVNVAAGAANAISGAIGSCYLEAPTATTGAVTSLPASRGSGAGIYIFYGIVDADSLLEGQGRFFYADTSEQDGAVLLAEVWTSSTAVTNVFDRRRIIERPRAIHKSVNQTAHGFAVGDYIRVSGVNTYTKALATSTTNAEVVGVVSAVPDVNNFTYALPGSVMSNLSGLTAGTMYLLSAAVAGTHTTTEPSIGQIRKRLLVAISATEGIFMPNMGSAVTGLTITTVTATSSIAASTDTHQVNSASNTTQTLPGSALTNLTSEVAVKNLGTGTVTITAPGGTTMESGDKTITTQYGVQRFYLDGTVWRVK